MQYQLISQPIESIPHNPDLARRNEGRRDHRVIRTYTDEALLLEIAGSLNSNDLLNQFSRFIVQSCADPFTANGTNSQGVCNLPNLTEEGLMGLWLELQANEGWMDDYRDGVELWASWARLAIYSSSLEFALSIQGQVLDSIESNYVRIREAYLVSILDCLPSYQRLLREESKL